MEAALHRRMATGGRLLWQRPSKTPAPEPETRPWGPGFAPPGLSPILATHALHATVLLVGSCVKNTGAFSWWQVLQS